jgi:hypothetical protein
VPFEPVLSGRREDTRSDKDGANQNIFHDSDYRRSLASLSSLVSLVSLVSVSESSLHSLV